MNASSTAFRGLVDIFVAPRDALQAAGEHPRRLWLPLTILLAAMVGFWIWYYQTVNIGWLIDHFVSLAGEDVTPEQQEAMRGFMSPTTLMMQAVFGTVVVIVCIMALVALYLHIVAKVGGRQELEYGRWFSLVSWSSFPSVLIVAGMALNYGLSDSGQIGPEKLSVTSFASLFGLDVTAGDWQRALGSFDLVNFWQIGLMGLGVSMYSRTSLTRGVIVAAVPYAFFYGISLLIALL